MKALIAAILLLIMLSACSHNSSPSGHRTLPAKVPDDMPAGMHRAN